MEGRVERAALASVLAMLAGALWIACSHPSAPVSDLALIEMQVAAVFEHAPLVGTYSRFGWSHPGPAMFWVLAVPYHLAGRAPEGLLVGVTLINVVAVLGIARLAQRRGGRALCLIALAALTLLLRAVGLALLTSPWNPYVPLLPFVWFLFLAWDTACGARWAMPLAVGVGSFVAQSYIGYALPAGTLLALGVGIALARHGRELRAALVVSAAVAVVLWLPVVVEQVTSVEGNLTLLWRFFMGGVIPSGRESLGIPGGAGLLARELVGFAPWMGGGEEGVVELRHPGWLLVPALALGAAAVLVYRRDHGDALRGLVVAAAAAAITGIALTGIVGGRYAYLVRWTWGVALFFDVMVLWALSRVVTVPTRLRQAAAWSVVVAMFGLSVATIVRDRHAVLPHHQYTPAVEGLTRAVVAWLRETRARSVLVDKRGWCGPPYSGLVAALARRGFAVRVPDGALPGDLEHLRIAGRPVDETVIVACGRQQPWLRRRDMRRIALYAPAADEDPRAIPIPIGVFIGRTAASPRDAEGGAG